MNSIIEAQQQFTDVFGELTLEQACSGVVLPHFSREQMEIQMFIENHQKCNPKAVVVTVQETKYSSGLTHYQFK